MIKNYTKCGKSEVATENKVADYSLQYVWQTGQNSCEFSGAWQTDWVLKAYLNWMVLDHRYGLGV